MSKVNYMAKSKEEFIALLQPGVLMRAQHSYFDHGGLYDYLVVEITDRTDTRWSNSTFIRLRNEIPEPPSIFNYPVGLFDYQGYSITEPNDNDD